MGVTDEQIRALSFYERSAAFDEVEKAVILHADRLTRGAVAVRDGTLQDLRRHFSEDEAKTQLDIAIDWGRYAELYEYDAADDQLRQERAES